MTALELYQLDPAVRGFFDCWVADRRCPIQLVDYLRDRDMYRAASAARWAATAAALPGVDTALADEGPYPSRDERYYIWFNARDWPSSEFDPERNRFTSHDVAEHAIADHLRSEAHMTGPIKGAVGAMLWLLDNWLLEDPM